MLFESRGLYKTRVEFYRGEHIENIIDSTINNFLYEYVYDFKDSYGYFKASLTDYAINKYNVEEDEIDTNECLARDILVQNLMRYKNMLMEHYHSVYELTYLESINETKKVLKGDEDLYEILRCLKKTNISLDITFEKEVVEQIKKQLQEHINEIKDIELGKPTKTIEQKEEIIEKELKELKELMEKHEIAERNASQVYQELYEMGAFDDDKY